MAARFWVGGNGTWDASDTTHWASSSGGAGGQSVPSSSDTVTLDGNSGASIVITVNANVTASSVALGTTGGNFTGTLDFATNNNSPTFGSFAFSGSGTRTLNLGSGTFTLTGTSLVFDLTTATGLTFSGGSATLLLSATTAAGRNITIGAANTIGTVSIGANTSGGEVTFTGPGSATLTLTNLSVTAPNRLIFLGSSARVYTLTNAPTLTGSSGSYITIVNSGGATFPTINGSVTGSYCAVGGITWGTGTQSFTNSWNLGGNTGSGFSLSAPVGAAGVIGG